MRPALTVGLIGAAVLAAGVLVVRHQQDQTPDLGSTLDAPSQTAHEDREEISLDRLRARGF